MRHRLTRTGMILLVGLLALAIPACRKPFSPQAISADLVPDRIRSSSVGRNVSEVVWHVSQEDWHEGLSLYAKTYMLASPDGYKYRIAHVKGVQSDPKLHGASAIIEIQDDHAFFGQTGKRSGIIEGDDDPYNIAVSIHAGGYCFDSRAIEVVAKTTEGREFRCPVTNGFWLIVVNDAKPAPNPVAVPLELWAEITARSSSGKVLHYLDLGSAGRPARRPVSSAASIIGPATRARAQLLRNPERLDVPW